MAECFGQKRGEERTYEPRLSLNSLTFLPCTPGCSGRRLRLPDLVFASFLDPPFFDGLVLVLLLPLLQLHALTTAARYTPLLKTVQRTVSLT